MIAAPRNVMSEVGRATGTVRLPLNASARTRVAVVVKE